MKIIQPYDLSVYQLDVLIKDGSLISAENNKAWRAAIFPSSTTVQALNQFDMNNIITQVDDVVFSDFTVLAKSEQLVSYNNGYKFVKCVEFGDYSDSVKRYAQLDRPLSYSSSARDFLKLSNNAMDQNDQLNLRLDDLIHAPGELSKAPTTDALGNSEITHPFISQLPSNNTPYRYNNKTVLLEVIRWAKAKGIKYIYCINENRPYAVSKQYVTPYVYYTVRGSF